MSSILRIQFPEDFEKQYEKYKASFLGGKINQEENQVPEQQEDLAAAVNKKPKTDAGKNGVGYLIFHDQKIQLGKISTGKFKLAETLCNDSFGTGKTIETVFEITKPKKDKNKIDGNLNDPYMGPSRKFTLMENQVREINREITEHVKRKKVKNFGFRLTLKSNDKIHPTTVWLEERVG